MSDYVQPSCFAAHEGDEVTSHDELVHELGNLNDRISDLEDKLSKALDKIELLGKAAALLIHKVDQQP